LLLQRDYWPGDRRRLQDLTDSADQPFNLLMKVASGIDMRRIAECKILDAIGQLGGFGHCRPVNQDRDDRNVPLQSSFNLDADRIVCVLDPEFSVRFGAKPPCSHDDNQNVALKQHTPDVLAKIDSKRNVIDIHKNRVGTVPRGQSIENTSRYSGGIGAAI
jgi:hypothetical protein